MLRHTQPRAGSPAQAASASSRSVPVAMLRSSAKLGRALCQSAVSGRYGWQRDALSAGDASGCSTSQLAMPQAHSRTSVRAAAAAAAPAATAQQKTVIFVMGGPGSGKGTQCERLEKAYDLAFYSAGELLRGLIRSGTEEGNRLQSIIMEGKIVPSSVTVGLLQKAIAETSKQTVLIDGFPRNMENWEVWQQLVGRDCDLAIFFDCPEPVMLKRLLGRNSGRADDNEATIRKRVQGFQAQTMPVVELYRKSGALHAFDTNRSVDDVQAELRALMDGVVAKQKEAAVRG